MAQIRMTRSATSALTAARSGGGGGLFDDEEGAEEIGRDRERGGERVSCLQTGWP